MTNKLYLFSGPLRDIPLTTIQVGGGQLFSSQRGTVVIKAIDGSSKILRDVLYVLGLGVSLISARRLCKNGLKGSFDSKNIYFCKNDKLTVYTQQKDRLYVLKHISEEYTGKAFTVVIKREACRLETTRVASEPSSLYTSALLASEETKTKQDKDGESDKDLDKSDEEETTKNDRRNYRLIHRRFAHYRPSIL
jgi:hypothetical protein